NKVVEVRPFKANKGNAIKETFDFKQYDFCICLGDDKTDEDMFEVVNYHKGITIKVGKEYSLAQYCIHNVSQVLSLLSLLGEGNK
ncbi:MAG TPA: trehalose-phosphatase, partial [Cytophagaceae bacterium]|nr:trehalose-phosphatase [Cytophagaceae bacterium]